eukprot:CAMPEP_0174851706 /NCGR_PEP_ID=MMETSP1114-20130205/23454_1 /TAXON_ID=312471 /ORGANISM="Neobodo designis, Strain CCAP 1951/1" /LENGTH=190 /DNA_ID=CAMNT_0016086257 /DNA_START=40 /DNA_END=610 /DNA_ORIENTATION=-
MADFDAAVAVAEEYAAATGALHAALAEARLAHVSARMALEQRYADLGVHAVPEETHATRAVAVSADAATFDVVTVAPHEPSSDDDDDEKKKNDGEEATRRRPAGGASARGERRKWAADPATWFCSIPPHDLVQCQAAFRKCVECAARVATLRAAALKALAQQNDSDAVGGGRAEPRRGGHAPHKLLATAL